MALPEVLIVGRPNVGKSTLFNRLAGKSLALVDNQPGSTRDLKSFPVSWDGRDFVMTDSGGWVPGEKESIAVKVGQMLEAKMKKASALLWLVDGLDGITPSDEVIARNLRKSGMETFLVVNKSDQYEKSDEITADFQKFGFKRAYPISAMHGIGIDDLLDDLVAFLFKKGTKKTSAPEEESQRPLRLAILGKPNVGKSSLVNALLGEKRVIVDDLPGTTHDAIPVIIETGENPLIAVDTAGIRAHNRQDTRIENISVQQALYELQTCQVALFLVDAEKGITHQDVTISRIIFEAFRPVIVLVNKWDIHAKASEQADAERIIRRQLRHLQFAPILFTSAKTGKNLDRILPAVYQLFEESCRQISTGRVNAAFQAALGAHSPPVKHGHQVRILYGYQRPGHPPAFEILCNHPDSATPSYLRFLEGEIRKAFDMPSTPLQIVLKAKKVEYRPKPKRLKFK